MGDTAADIRQAQRDSWDTAAAGWWRWWPTMEAGSAQLNRRLLEMAGLGEGMRVLDVATGIGEPALSAAMFFADVPGFLARGRWGARDPLAVAGRAGGVPLR